MHAQTDRQAHTHPITPPTSLTHHSNLLTLTHPLARTHVIPGLFAESIPACRLKEPPPPGESCAPLCPPARLYRVRRGGPVWLTTFVWILKSLDGGRESERTEFVVVLYASPFDV